jgi:hypothetical protein
VDKPKATSGVTLDSEDEVVTLERFGDVMNWFGPLKIPQPGEKTTILDKVESNSYSLSLSLTLKKRRAKDRTRKKNHISKNWYFWFFRLENCSLVCGFMET